MRGRRRWSRPWQPSAALCWSCSRQLQHRLPPASRPLLSQPLPAGSRRRQRQPWQMRRRRQPRLQLPPAHHHHQQSLESLRLPSGSCGAGWTPQLTTRWVGGSLPATLAAFWQVIALCRLLMLDGPLACRLPGLPCQCDEHMHHETTLPFPCCCRLQYVMLHARREALAGRLASAYKALDKVGRKGHARR